jgi:competence protein ComEC
VVQQKYGNVSLQGMALLWVAGAWLVGILVDSSLQTTSLQLSSFALLISAVAMLICVALLWYDTRSRWISLIILFVILGAWRYSSVSPVGDPQAISAYTGAKVVIRGQVSDEPKFGSTSRLLSVSVQSISLDNGNTWRDVHGQMTVQIRDTAGADNPYEANYGSEVKIYGKVLSPFPAGPPGIAASMFFPRVVVMGIGGNPIIGALYQLRTMLANIIAQTLPQPLAALLIALLLSEHTAALKLLIPAFNQTGTAHLIAPSGFKVTILAAIVDSNMTWLYKKKGAPGKLLPAQRRGGWRRWLATALTVISIVIYTILSGAGPAAVRAGIMGVLLVIAPRIGRRYNIYTALAGAALLMSALDPFVAWDVGFQLSFLGTLGIVLLTPLFQRLLHPLERISLCHYLVETLAVTLAAEVATLPIIALNFQIVSFVAPLTNMLTVPLLGILLVLGVLICIAGCICMPIALLVGWVAQPLLWYLSHIVTWSANLPGAYSTVGPLDSSMVWGYYVLLVPLVWRALRKWPTAEQRRSTHDASPRISRRAWQRAQLGVAALFIVATGTATLLPHSNSQVTITFLHVGPVGKQAQGEAILIRTPDDKTILIDGGLDATSLGQELDSRLPPWQRSLDAVVLTTPRQDHLNGLLDIVKRYSIGETIDSGMLHPGTTYALWRRTISERNFRYLAAKQGTNISIGMFVSLQVLWPARPLHKGSDEVRDNGLIVRVVTPGMRLLLLSASAQSKYALTGLLNDVATPYLQADVVQIVEDASTPEELSTVLQRSHPAVLLMSPASVVKQRKGGKQAQPSSLPLKDNIGWKIAQIVQTAREGTVELSSDQSGWSMNIV